MIKTTLSKIAINKQLDALIYFNKLNELKDIIDKNILSRERNLKFSGKKLIDIGINNKLIGSYINNFKSYISKTYQMDFNNWLDKSDNKIVDENLQKFISEFGSKM